MAVESFGRSGALSSISQRCESMLSLQGQPGGKSHTTQLNMQHSRLPAVLCISVPSWEARRKTFTRSLKLETGLKAAGQKLRTTRLPGLLHYFLFLSLPPRTAVF